MCFTTLAVEWCTFWGFHPSSGCCHSMSPWLPVARGSCFWFFLSTTHIVFEILLNCCRLQSLGSCPWMSPWVRKFSRELVFMNKSYLTTKNCLFCLSNTLRSLKGKLQNLDRKQYITPSENRLKWVFGKKSMHKKPPIQVWKWEQVGHYLLLNL